MRVNIDEIKEGGLDRAWDLATPAVDEMVKDDPPGYRAKQPLHVEGKLRKMGSRVLLEAHAAAELVAPCGRCLAPVGVSVPVDFHMTFVPAEGAGRGQAGPEADDDPHLRRGGWRASSHEESEEFRVRAPGKQLGSFSPDEVDEETYTGKSIELDNAVREQLVLALPQYPVCGDGCKGLCPVCGTNLNERECGCDRHVPDPRWAGLQKLKDRTKEG